MSNNIYNILGKLKTLTESAEPAAPEATVYENVEPRGSITEAVRSLESKFATFKEAKAKPDFLDVDKDGNKAEPFKKAVKDKKAKQVDEGQGPYELYNPKHPKFKANHDKWMKKNPGKKLADFVAAMKKKEATMNEAAYDEPAAPDADAVAKRKRLQAIKDRQEEQGDDYSDTKSNVRKVAGKAYGGAAQAADADDDLDEAMFPGSSIGKSLRNTDQGLRRGSDAIKAGAVGAVASGAGAGLGVAAQTSMATGATALFAPAMGAGMLMGASAVLGTALTYKALQWLARKLFGTSEEALEFAKAHLAAAEAGQPQFQFQGKNYPVKVKPDQIRDLKDEITNLQYNRVAAKQRESIEEVAPPGAKAERMVKHIKKGYAKDGKLSKKEKGIAYATAWKAHNKGQVEEGVEFKDTIANSKAELKKAKLAKVTEGRVMEETDYFYEKIGKALAEQNPHLDTATGEFVDAVRKEMVAQGIPPNRARGIIMMDEDFISDVATSYGHYCKDVAEDIHQSNIPSPTNAMPVTSPMEELDEIARLAGISTPTAPQSKGIEHSVDTMDEGDELIAPPKAVSGKVPSAKATGIAPAKPGVPPTPTFNEEDMAEGNEFSGALAAAKASGAKEFEVDGKRYTVKEDININITASGEQDALNLIRKLSGMDEVEAVRNVGPVIDAESAIAQGIVEPVEEERDIEYANTPNEKIGPISAAIPSGNDMHKSKQSYSDKPYRGDNPMTVKEDTLWEKYEDMINDVKE